MGRCDAVHFEDGGRGDEPRWFLEAGKGKGKDMLPEETWCRLCQLDFSPMNPISDGRPPELYNNKCVLFEAIKCVIICYSSNR